MESVPFTSNVTSSIPLNCSDMGLIMQCLSSHRERYDARSATREKTIETKATKAIQTDHERDRRSSQKASRGQRCEGRETG
jgi:hypothetical protein